MFGNLKPSDQVNVAGVINFASTGAGTVSSGYMSMADYRQLLATIALGTLGASATINAKLRQAKDSGGTDVKDITGKAITQLDTAGNKLALINLRAEELDINNGFTHVKLDITVGVAASVVGAVIQGFEARYAPASHIAGVAEVIA